MRLLKARSRKPRLRILGDHSKFHGGCKAVMRTLRRIALSKGWRVVGDRDDYDALLVNGEGSMHHGGKRFHKKMQSLESALECGKPAYLVNSVWQDNPSDYDRVLRQLSGVFVREVYSQTQLLEKHGVRATVLPDASYFDQPPRFLRTHQFGNRPAVTDFLVEPKRINGRRNVFKRLDNRFPEAACLPFTDWSWGKTVASLRTAKYLITGRHHAVYAACVARVPFIASEGNTHKIGGLVHSAGADIRVASSPQEIPEIIDYNLQRHAEYERIFDWIDSHDIRAMIPSPSVIAGPLAKVA